MIFRFWSTIGPLPTPRLVKNSDGFTRSFHASIDARKMWKCDEKKGKEQIGHRRSRVIDRQSGEKCTMLYFCHRK